MLYKPQYPTLPISNVSPGSFIAFDLRGTTRHALAVTPQHHGEEGPGLIGIGHPSEDFDGFEYLSKSVLISPRVVVFPGATLSIRPEHLSPFFNSINIPKGSVFLTDRGPALIAGVQGIGRKAFDLSTGEVANVEQSGLPWASSWAVLTPDANGKLMDVVKITAP